MASFLWWIVGFYWIVSGGNVLLHDAPHLYWYDFHYWSFSSFSSRNMKCTKQRKLIVEILLRDCCRLSYILVDLPILICGIFH